MSDGGDTPTRAGLMGSATLFYAAMAAIGVALMDAQDLPLVAAVFGDAQTTWRDAALGAGAGLVVVGLTWLLRNVSSIAKLNAELRPLLGPLDTPTIAVLAVTSAIGEELFFRGALQPLMGFWPTVLVFGLMHGGTRRRLALWAAFATVAGLLLGALTVYTGNLLAAFLAHLTINFWNLHAMLAPPSPPPGSPP